MRYDFDSFIVFVYVYLRGTESSTQHVLTFYFVLGAE